MTRIPLLAFAALALAACAKESASGPDAAPSAIAQDPAAQPIEGEPDSAWVEMMGAWAPERGCGDHLSTWLIEGEAFQLYEMRCEIKTLALLRNGVRARADCTVEGYNDGVPDEFYFLRRADGSLSIVQAANGAAYDGLRPCAGEDAEL